MAQMLIRNLDEAVVSGLKRRAAENRTSAEEEARRALSASVGPDIGGVLAALEAVRTRIGPVPGPDSTERLRWDRDRDTRPDGAPDA